VLPVDQRAAAPRLAAAPEMPPLARDPLTGLLTRRAFQLLGSALAAEADARAPLVVVVLGLDGFDLINRRSGRLAGDTVLVTVGRRLSEYAIGDPVARLGGSEFAALLTSPTGGRRWLRQTASRLAARLTAPIPVGPATIALTASVGLVPVPECPDLPAALYRAEQAMRHARDRLDPAAGFARVLDNGTVRYPEMSRAMPGSTGFDVAFAAAAWLGRQP
jgi:diguanylate cyclase (GGDEF)-like protein